MRGKQIYENQRCIRYISGGNPFVRWRSLPAAPGLDAVEWGGDIHVPPGNAQAARAALHCTRENGLTVSAYGSYYRAGAEEDFGPVLETALSLGCRVIRVWAGRQGSALCTQEERRAVTACLARAAERAAQAGCVVATEYHADTLTDTLASALALLGEAPGLRTLWAAACWPYGRRKSARAARAGRPSGKSARLSSGQRRRLPPSGGGNS